MDQSLCIAAQPAGGSLGPLALQVLSLGVLWTSLHCSGMCGPLIAGLRFGARGEAIHPARAAVDLLAYQAGRAVIYAGMGALAGTVGMSASMGLQRWAPVVTLLAALAFIWTALRRLRGAAAVGGPPGRIARWSATVSRVWQARPLRRAMALGAVLAFMPCLLLFWVLSLAAASGDPLHGAILTVLLVVLTVPVLLAAAVVPTLVGRWRSRCAPWIGPTAMLVSAGWLLLIGLAGLDLVPHAHLRWGDYLVMFW